MTAARRVFFSFGDCALNDLKIFLRRVKDVEVIGGTESLAVNSPKCKLLRGKIGRITWLLVYVRFIVFYCSIFESSVSFVFEIGSRIQFC